MIAEKLRTLRQRFSPPERGKLSPSPSTGEGRSVMGPLPRGRAPVLGIEIARGGLRFVELKNVGGRPALLQHGVIAYGASEELGGVLQFLVEEYSIEAKDVHVVDTTSRANLKIQTLPRMPHADLDLVIRGEIATEGELLGEALVGDWMLLDEGPRENTVLVGKIPVRDRELLATACGGAGLRLQVMTSSSVALAHHLLSTGEVPEGETVGLLDIGRAKMNMALMTGTSVRLVREVYQGLSAAFLKESGAEEEADLEAIGAGLDEMVATVQQIQRTVRQYQEQNPGVSLHHLAITGETTRISRVIGLLQHDLRVPVVPYSPAAGPLRGDLPEDFERAASTFAVPWVLATTPAVSIPLNFTEGVPDRRPVRALQAVGVGSLVGMIALGAWDVAQSRHLTRLQETAATFQAEKTNLEVELGLLEDVRILWNRWIQEQTGRNGVPAPDFRPHLAEVIAGLPEEVRLTRLIFRSEGSEWTLHADAVARGSGSGQSHASMERFVGSIDGSPLLTDVSMLPLRYESDQGRSTLEFSVVASVVPVAPEGTS